jgi:hypothetical protein
MRRTLSRLGPWSDSDEKRLVELVTDDGTNSNVFNNALRALMCVEAKARVSLLERLHEFGLLID